MANYSIINLASTAGSEEISKLGNEIIGAELEDKNVTFDITKFETLFVFNSKDLSGTIGIILIDEYTDEGAFEFVISKLENSKCPTIYGAPYNKEAHEKFDNFKRVGGDTTSLNVEGVIEELKTLEENSFDPKTLGEERGHDLVNNLVTIIRTIYSDGAPLEPLFGREKFIKDSLYQFGVSRVEKNLDEIDYFIDILNRKITGRRGLEVEELEVVFVLSEVLMSLIKNSSIITQRDIERVLQSRQRSERL